MADRETTPAFTADLLFHYEVDGIRHTGTRLWPAKQSDRDYRSLAEVREPLIDTLGSTAAIPSGTAAVCFVNPSDPSQAALAKPSASWSTLLPFAIAFGFFLFIGVCLVIIGFRKNSERIGRWLIGAVLLFFATAGLALLGVALNSFRESARTVAWREATGEVIWSRTVRTEGRRRPPTIPDVFYRYEVRGREFRSNCYSPDPSAFTGSAAIAVAAEHSQDSQLTLRYDPAAPWRSFVEQGDDMELLFTLLLGILFLGLPIGCIFLTRKRRRLAQLPAAPRNPRRRRSMRDRSGGRW